MWKIYTGNIRGRGQYYEFVLMYVYNILPISIDVTTIPKSMEGDTVKYENDKIQPRDVFGS